MSFEVDMSGKSIVVEGVSKTFRVRGGGARRHNTLRDQIAGLFSGARGGAARDFAALSDVSFSVKPGERLAIIGANGAGKSTLLKILSGVTLPSTGTATLSGRLASLLEVNTGFHSELTARENIFLKGALHGMSRREIGARVDAILDFAGVVEFADTPVKRFSSGMYVRLAFAVMAHLDPEILIVDEVLAVGDAAFQRKCVERLGSIGATGQTLLFVTHNLSIAESLCDRAILLEHGRIVADGPVGTIVRQYLANNAPSHGGLGETVLPISEGDNRAARVAAISATARRPDGRIDEVLRTGHDFEVALRVAAKENLRNITVALIVYDSSGFRLIDANTEISGDNISLVGGQTTEIVFRLRDLRLRPGQYVLGTWLGRRNEMDIESIQNALFFDVYFGAGRDVRSETYPGVYQCAFDVYTRRV